MKFYWKKDKNKIKNKALEIIEESKVKAIAAMVYIPSYSFDIIKWWETRFSRKVGRTTFDLEIIHTASNRKKRNKQASKRHKVK